MTTFIILSMIGKGMEIDCSRNQTLEAALDEYCSKRPGLDKIMQDNEAKSRQMAMIRIDKIVAWPGDQMDKRVTITMSTQENWQILDNIVWEWR